MWRLSLFLCSLVHNPMRDAALINLLNWQVLPVFWILSIQASILHDPFTGFLCIFWFFFISFYLKYPKSSLALLWSFSGWVNRMFSGKARDQGLLEPNMRLALLVGLYSSKPGQTHNNNGACPVYNDIRVVLTGIYNSNELYDSEIRKSFIPKSGCICASSIQALAGGRTSCRMIYRLLSYHKPWGCFHFCKPFLPLFCCNSILTWVNG